MSDRQRDMNAAWFEKHVEPRVTDSQIVLTITIPKA